MKGTVRALFTVATCHRMCYAITFITQSITFITAWLTFIVEVITCQVCMTVCLFVLKLHTLHHYCMYMLNYVHLFFLTQAPVVDVDKQKLVRRVSIIQFQSKEQFFIWRFVKSCLRYMQFGDETSILPSKVFQYLEHNLVSHSSPPSFTLPLSFCLPLAHSSSLLSLSSIVHSLHSPVHCQIDITLPLHRVPLW